ncbi:hypothetical protein VagYM19_23040 [Vibrio alginolyticus]|uniref:hypothetical protein n=1 Tax=Vibrio TaxID=662 RepID=UPI00046CE668|nr:MULTISPECIES: hypothetical protein [Vibrio]EKF9435901.1 hypothetical protein [Vibrio cholerae]TBT35797.1 hypothetical protein D5E85_07885 [Vibrio parahaemolyticus]BCB43174.1 hypothetical protein Vag1382_23010 [Vibrio alginolyticus]BCB47775.1 hypothetical protein VagVIO5_23010 [Vibrio alginolyticus]BCB52377.1 hypothetical protein VagYM19_23040 [Vibrio alginolyticus]
MHNHDNLTRAIAAFNHWRLHRTNKHGPIPDELRRLAITLLDDYRVGQITQALLICSTQLKDWRKQFSSEPTSVPEFVPISIEVENRTSSQLTLKLILPNSTQILIDGQISSDLLRTLIQEAGERP